MYFDPVCKKMIPNEQTKATSTYKNKTYSFCCEECQNKFNQDPEKYIGRNWWQRFLYRLAENNAEEFGEQKPSCHD